MIYFFIILLLIFVNGFFAMAEIAIISSRKNRLKFLAGQGNRKAQIAYHLAEKPNKFLSTVQVGITFIGIMTGAMSDKSIVLFFASFLKPIPFIGAYHEQVGFALSIVVITYISIVLGELVPKAIAIGNPEKIASSVAPFMKLFSEWSSPIVKFLTISTETVVQILGIKHIASPAVTEEEIRVMIREGRDVGIFNKTEIRLVEQALLLDDLLVKNVMTPRSKIRFFDIEDFTKNPRSYLLRYPHSRIIFTKNGTDKIIGATHVKDILQHYVGEKSEHIDIEKMLSKPYFIPEDMRALRLLEMFRHSPTHIALVTNDLGHVVGLITINDIFVALVGEIRSYNSSTPLHP